MASRRSIRFPIPDGNKNYQRFVVNHATYPALLFLHGESKVRSSVTQSLLNKPFAIRGTTHEKPIRTHFI
jgi:hypothetical protein